MPPRGRVYSGALRADARSGAFAVALLSLAESTEESLVRELGWVRFTQTQDHHKCCRVVVVVVVVVVVPRDLTINHFEKTWNICWGNCDWFNPGAGEISMRIVCVFFAA